MGKSSFLKDFKEFAMKGNVLDMAVGVVIGGAFGKIVSSLVSDVIMPLVGLLGGGANFTNLKWVIKDRVIENGEVIKEAATLNYGIFIQNIVDFLIIAFTIFCVLRAMMKLKKQKEEEPAAPPAPSAEETLLTEIRDLLKNK